MVYAEEIDKSIIFYPLYVIFMNSFGNNGVIRIVVRGLT